MPMSDASRSTLHAACYETTASPNSQKKQTLLHGRETRCTNKRSIGSPRVVSCLSLRGAIVFGMCTIFRVREIVRVGPQRVQFSRELLELLTMELVRQQDELFSFSVSTWPTDITMSVVFLQSSHTHGKKKLDHDGRLSPLCQETACELDGAMTLPVKRHGKVPATALQQAMRQRCEPSTPPTRNALPKMNISVSTDTFAGMPLLARAKNYRPMPNASRVSFVCKKSAAFIQSRNAQHSHPKSVVIARQLGVRFAPNPRQNLGDHHHISVLALPCADTQLCVLSETYPSMSDLVPVSEAVSI